MSTDLAKSAAPDPYTATAGMHPRRVVHSAWTMPILRFGMALFLALWGVDKLVATTGAVGIFSHFYRVNVGAIAVHAAGIAEILVALALGAGVLRKPVAWIVLVMNLVSIFASWRQILDPWGFFGLTKGGAHLFLASLVVTAVSIALVLNAEDDVLSLDAALHGRQSR